MADEVVDVRGFRRSEDRDILPDPENSLIDDRTLFDEVKELEMQFSSIMEDLEDVKRISGERKSH